MSRPCQIDPHSFGFYPRVVFVVGKTKGIHMCQKWPISFVRC